MESSLFTDGVYGIGILSAPCQFEGTDLEGTDVCCIWFQIQVELDLKYQPPEGAAGTWAEEDFGTPIRDR